MKIVLLTSGTVGTTSDSAEVGQIATVRLHSENGAFMQVTGIVSEILES